jgi:hypothetical protein
MISLFLLVALSSPPGDGKPGLERAIAFLSREVPRWSKENHCYSCHNNGDAARALYIARKLAYKVPAAALASTTQWVGHPEKWDSNRGNPAFSDKGLARIQFAASLAEAVDAGLVRDRAALQRAADSLLPAQTSSGAWQVDSGAPLGSPATYGPYLATYMARRTLERSDCCRDAIARADAWFRQASPAAVLDASARILALEDRAQEWRSSLEALTSSQNPDGGWGPYRHSPSEPFDTALAMLALNAVKDRTPEARQRISRGRAWLLQVQLPSGAWTETTRPAGAQSYAQHISTAGWATLALLATSPATSR